MRRVSLLFVLAAGCGDGSPPPPPPAPRKEPAAEAKPGIPDRVRYDQILVAFKGSYVLDGKVVVDTERTKEEAEALARTIFDRARAGFDFAALRQEFSDDRDPRSLLARGPYWTVRDGVRPQGLELLLSKLHRGFADVVYRLKVGEVGLVEHDPKRCPDGWYVVKRIE